MKPLLPFIFLMFCGCVTEEIQMRETALKLTAIERDQIGNEENLTLKWQSLDGHIRIVTNAPEQDSNQYVVGTVYARCFLKR